jgi:glycosyltransferase involved in cell wall biosynthesis
MKIAFVISRYSPDISGGAEKYTQLLAELLTSRHTVEVLTTTAIDYLTWNPCFKEGQEIIHGVMVRRFHARHPRKRLYCAALWRFLVRFPYPESLQEAWFKASGPYSDSFLAYLRESGAAYDVFIFMIYFSSFTLFALPLVADKALFIPLAHDEPSIRWSLFKRLFDAPAGYIFNTPDEKELLLSLFPIASRPSITSGIAVEVPEQVRGEDFFEKFPLLKGKEYIVYVGRVSRSKKVPLLMEYFIRYCRSSGRDLCLVLIGDADFKVPLHPGIVHTGYVTEELKYSCIKGAAALVNPSPYESLSMVLIEAWHMETPVLVNGDCNVLRGQVERSGGGLCYRDYDSFCTGLQELLDNKDASRQMAQSGRCYAFENYSREVIERKVNGFLEQFADLLPKKV